MSETNSVSPLRRRMIEDMAARKLNPHTQRSHVYSCKRFAAWLKRSPDTATPDEVRRFQLPDAKGYTSMERYLAGETDEIRQRRRDEILGASVTDFRAFADVLADLAAHGQVVLLGSEHAIQAVNARRPGLLQISNAMY